MWDELYLKTIDRIKDIEQRISTFESYMHKHDVRICENRNHHQIQTAITSSMLKRIEELEGKIMQVKAPKPCEEGLTLTQALFKLNNGTKIKRKIWMTNYITYHQLQYNAAAVFTLKDLTATDWVVYYE